MKTIVLNGWAASEQAWKRCEFNREVIYSYTQLLDGEFSRAIAAEDEGVVCVGWSMGGGMLLEGLLEFPEKIKAVVLVAATPRMKADDGWKGMTERRIEALRRGLELSLLGQNLFDGPDPKWAYAVDTEENLSRGLDYLRNLDCRTALKEASLKGLFENLPVRILQSTRDAIVRPTNADFLSSIFPKSKKIIIEGSSHALPATSPESVDNAVEEVLREV